MFGTENKQHRWFSAIEATFGFTNGLECEGSASDIPCFQIHLTPVYFLSPSVKSMLGYGRGSLGCDLYGLKYISMNT